MRQSLRLVGAFAWLLLLASGQQFWENESADENENENENKNENEKRGEGAASEEETHLELTSCSVVASF